jgi:hypothetical protein
MACVGNTPTDIVDGGIDGGAVSSIDDIDNNRDEVLFKLYVNKLPFKSIRAINDDILIADGKFILDKNYTKIDDTQSEYHRHILFSGNQDELRHQVEFDGVRYQIFNKQHQKGEHPDVYSLWDVKWPHVENILYSNIEWNYTCKKLSIQCVVKDEYGKLRSVKFRKFLNMEIEWESNIHTKTSTWFIGKNAAIKFDINTGFGDLIHFKGILREKCILNDRIVFITWHGSFVSSQPKGWVNREGIRSEFVRRIINPYIYDDEFNEVAQFKNAMITGITSNCIYISEMELTNNGEWKPIAAHEISYKRVDYDKLCLNCTNLRSDEIILSCGHRSYCEKCVSNISTCSICHTEVKIITIK